ncbi:hypothetical protein EBH_0020210 [Eimeria brunetti]|uniref:Uncharacterized protein n=1 Tax=Eimeria brunetti TaxID=51314 RepID=U6LD40_9EIME|nr:hypothetical protein EBH_0020210 [Eimeria brunetti]
MCGEALLRDGMTLFDHEMYNTTLPATRVHTDSVMYGWADPGCGTSASVPPCCTCVGQLIRRDSTQSVFDTHLLAACLQHEVLCIPAVRGIVLWAADLNTKCLSDAVCRFVLRLRVERLDSFAGVVAMALMWPVVSACLPVALPAAAASLPSR